MHWHGRNRFEKKEEEETVSTKLACRETWQNCFLTSEQSNSGVRSAFCLCLEAYYSRSSDLTALNEDKLWDHESSIIPSDFWPAMTVVACHVIHFH